MPEVDGLSPALQVKALWPQVKAIVLSVYTEHYLCDLGPVLQPLSSGKPQTKPCAVRAARALPPGPAPTTIRS